MKYFQLLVLAILLIAPASLGYADLVTYNFTGSITAITENQNNAIPNLDVGDTFSGFAKFEANGWNQTSGTMHISLNGVDLFFDGPLVWGNAVLGPNFYSLRVQGDGPGNTPQTTFRAVNFGPELVDSNGSAGVTQILPTSLNLQEFETNIFTITGMYLPTNSRVILTGKLDTFAAVPEPASILGLIGAASTCLIRQSRQFAARRLQRV